MFWKQSVFCGVLRCFADVLWKLFCAIQQSKFLVLGKRTQYAIHERIVSISCFPVFFDVFRVCFACFVEILQNTRETPQNTRKTSQNTRKTPQNPFANKTANSPNLLTNRPSPNNFARQSYVGNMWSDEKNTILYSDNYLASKWNIISY